MSRVLTVGNDTSLLHTRSLVLEKTGSTVCCTQPEPALALLQKEFFEVVVLCHTVSQRDRVALCKQIGQLWPSSRIVTVGVSAFSSSSDDVPDISVPWQLGPQALIDVVTPLLQQSSLHNNSRKTVSAALMKPYLLQVSSGYSRGL